MELTIFELIMAILAVLGTLDKIILILDGFFNFLNDFFKGIFEFIDENAKIIFWIILILLN